MRRLRIPRAKCEICGRGATTGFNRPHSLHRTKKIVKINLQRQGGKLICTSCLRTQSRLPRQAKQAKPPSTQKAPR